MTHREPHVDGSGLVYIEEGIDNTPCLTLSLLASTRVGYPSQCAKMFYLDSSLLSKEIVVIFLWRQILIGVRGT